MVNMLNSAKLAISGWMKGLGPFSRFLVYFGAVLYFIGMVSWIGFYIVEGNRIRSTSEYTANVEICTSTRLFRYSKNDFSRLSDERFPVEFKRKKSDILYFSNRDIASTIKRSNFACIHLSRHREKGEWLPYYIVKSVRVVE